MPLPVVSTPPTEGDFVLTLADASTYSIPAALAPVTLTPGRPVDSVGRAVGSTTWVRHGPSGLNPEPLRFFGRLWGSNAVTQLNDLQTAARAAVSITDGVTTQKLDGGDVSARERSLTTFDVTLMLFPTSPVEFE